MLLNLQNSHLLISWAHLLLQSHSVYMVITCSNLDGIFPEISEDHIDGKLNFQFQNPGLSGLLLV